MYDDGAIEQLAGKDYMHPPMRMQKRREAWNAEQFKLLRPGTCQNCANGDIARGLALLRVDNDQKYFGGTNEEFKSEERFYDGIGEADFKKWAANMKPKKLDLIPGANKEKIFVMSEAGKLQLEQKSDAYNLIWECAKCKKGHTTFCLTQKTPEEIKELAKQLGLEAPKA